VLEVDSVISDVTWIELPMGIVTIPVNVGDANVAKELISVPESVSG
jgi:hypothetical protein